MADLSDVTDTLVQMVAGALYPRGAANPSPCGYDVVIFAGWPLPADLARDLAAGKAQVSVYPRTDERKTTRYLDEWQQATCNPALLTLTIEGSTVIVGGQVPPAGNPHHLVVMVNGRPYPYLVHPTDTLATVAAAIAQLVDNDFPGGASSSGAVITLSDALNLSAARVGITQTAMNEVRRQDRLFQITIWANSPEMRTAVARPVDLLFAQTRRFTLPDDTFARLIYRSSPETDMLQKVRIYRRDLFYTVEYGTFESETVSQITQFQTNVGVDVAGAILPIATTYS